MGIPAGNGRGNGSGSSRGLRLANGRVAGNNLHERISLVGPQDELKELADTCDAMLERLNASFDGLLTLARCENQAIERLPVDLSDVAAGAVEETAAEAAAAGVTIDAAPYPAARSR